MSELVKIKNFRKFIIVKYGSFLKQSAFKAYYLNVWDGYLSGKLQASKIKSSEFTPPVSST